MTYKELAERELEKAKRNILQAWNKPNVTAEELENLHRLVDYRKLVCELMNIDVVVSKKEITKEVAREIFEEIEKFDRRPIPESKPVYILKQSDFDELKKKYGVTDEVQHS